MFLDRERAKEKLRPKRNEYFDRTNYSEKFNENKSLNPSFDQSFYATSYVRPITHHTRIKGQSTQVHRHFKAWSRNATPNPAIASPLKNIGL